MSETLTTTAEPTTEATHRPNEVTFNGEQLFSKMWGEETTAKTDPPVKEDQATEQPIQTETKQEQTTTTPPEEEEEILDPNEWLKREFSDIEDINTLKQEREEYKKLKTQKPEEIKFDNDDSKTLYELIRQGKKKEVREILDKQEKLDFYTTTPVTADTEADIIKLGMQLSNKLLTKEDIDFKYNQEYGIPREPVQKVTESDEDFQERVELWNERVKTAEMKKIVDAKMAIPQLEQLKTQIVFPNIEKPQDQPKPPTQEELDAAKRYFDAFVQSVDSSMKNFNGVSVPVKNEVVDFTVSYGTADEEKTAIANVMKNFAKENYDANALFAELWVNKDNTLKVDEMINDYHFIKNKNKIIQKIANDSANKAIEAFVKGKKNINIRETHQNATVELTKEDKTEMDTVRDKFFGS